MGTINQFACSHCNLVGKFKLIEPKSSPNTKGFAKEGFQKKKIKLTGFILLVGFSTFF